MESKIKPIIDETIIYGIISERKKKSSISHTKIEIRPFTSKGALKYQLSFKEGKKVFHENLLPSELLIKISDFLRTSFNQCVLYTQQGDYHLTNYKKFKFKKSTPSKSSTFISEHNFLKKYIFSENTPYDFLVKLGIMDEKGKVFKSKFNKFKQINKFIELVHASTRSFEKQDSLTIIDFGCGKSYLTFALYYYLKKIQNKNVDIIGLDLKEDVIDFCNKTASALNYTALRFQKGDIKDFSWNKNIDMVITLHACDTATDAAILQALKWNASVILTVPCCQHELFNQIQNPKFNILLKHGILKERLSSMITDTIRGQLLEACGYQVNIEEFIATEHTPKNILIKAIRTGPPSKIAYSQYIEFAKEWNIHPYLESSLIQNKLLNTHE